MKTNSFGCRDFVLCMLIQLCLIRTQDRTLKSDTWFVIFIVKSRRPVLRTYVMSNLNINNRALNQVSSIQQN